jgi:hypothetical protein
LTSRSRRALTLAETGTESTSGNCGNENTRNNLNIVQQNLCKILILLIIGNYQSDRSAITKGNLNCMRKNERDPKGVDSFILAFQRF